MNQSIKTYSELREDYLDLFRQIVSWCDDTFGEKRDMEVIHTKIVHKVDELGKAITGFIFKDFNADDVQEEIVDVMISLLQLYSRIADPGRLYMDILHKFEILQQRTWVKMENGTFQHKEGFSYILNFKNYHTVSGVHISDFDKIIWYADIIIPDAAKWDSSTLKSHLEQLKPDFKWDVEWLVGGRYRLKILNNLKYPVKVEVAFPFPMALEPGVVEKA